eukprot:363013-Chlamydomonas_euryale.AAC.3
MRRTASRTPDEKVRRGCAFDLQQGVMGNRSEGAQKVCIYCIYCKAWHHARPMERRTEGAGGGCCNQSSCNAASMVL